MIKLVSPTMILIVTLYPKENHGMIQIKKSKLFDTSSEVFFLTLQAWASLCLWMRFILSLRTSK